MGIPVAHVEAGLRSFDRSMPEELNRIVVDHLSNYLFVSELSGMQNLEIEGIKGHRRVVFVGNVMIDTLVNRQEHFLGLYEWENHKVKKGEYVLMTMHRPSNVDTVKSCRSLFALAYRLAEKWPVLFPMHPRTITSLNDCGMLGQFTMIENLEVMSPAGYLEFCSLMTGAKMVVTDSGGIQEETTYLCIPCVTVRRNTERPVTLAVGTNVLAPDVANLNEVMTAVKLALLKTVYAERPEKWDGQAAKRIWAFLTTQTNLDKGE